MMFMASGCAGEHKTAGGLPEGFNVRSVKMFNGRTGEVLTWEDVQDVFDEADVILIGEQHGHPVGLPVAATMWEDALNQNPNAALSLEFFERDQQIALDDYLAGITTEKQFEKAANRSEGNYPEGHKEMVEAAKEAGRPVIAANAPRRYVHIANVDGFDKLRTLNPEQQALIEIPETIPESGRYRDKFFDLMSDIHGTDEGDANGEDKEMTDDEKAEAEKKAKEQQEMIAKMFRSQNTWDVTMADSILKAIAAGDKPVVQVVGQFHTDFVGGIPNRLIERNPNLFIWTISMQDAWSDELRDDDKGRADCVVYVGPADH